MRAAPIIMNTTPAQRTGETFSPRKTKAAKVVMTKLNAVNGQRKVMSLFDIRINRQAKNSASKKTPSSTVGLVAPALVMRNTSAGTIFWTSPIWLMPFLSRTTPAASKTSPTSRINSSLAMLQVLVANQLDALCVNLCPHARADERIKFVSKFIKRGMRVKLGITGRKPRQQLRDVGFIDPLILQQPKDCASMADASTFE